MTRLEMVEKLREKAGVTYDVAREALEKCDWDMLDALMYLKSDDGGKARERRETRSEPEVDRRPEIVVDGLRERNTLETIGGKATGIIRFLLKLISKGENLRVEVLYKDEVIGSISVTVLVLLLLLAWFVPVALFILAFIFGFRFRFSNKNMAGRVLNNLGSNLKAEVEKEAEVEVVGSRFKED
ncbi:MAG: hypothetical protein II920_07605 [Clostridia bacterium]|nr:hypothetical protein [Clostridia bacterium]